MERSPYEEGISILENHSDNRRTDYDTDDTPATDQPLPGPRKLESKSKSLIRWQILAAVFATSSLISNGFHIGWPSPSLVKLLGNNSDVPITSTQGATLVVLLLVGLVFGGVASSFFVDKLGRKKMLLLSVLCFVPGCAILAFANKCEWFYLARVILGLGNGITYTVTTIYVGEIAEEKIRGGLGALVNTMVNVGVLIAYSVGPWVNRQYLAGVGATIPLVFALFFVWMPESPHILVMTNKKEAARKSLIWLRGVNDVDNDLATIVRNVEIQQRDTGSYKQLWMIPSNRTATLIGLGLMFAQELSGITAIIAYSELIFLTSGAKLSSSVSSIVVAVIQLIAGFFALLTTDLTGRKTLLLISTIGVIFFLSVEAVYFHLQYAGLNVAPIFWIPITGMIGFMISYTIGLGVLPTVISSEILACNVKAKGMMINTWGVGSGFLISIYIYQYVSDTYGIQYAFWLFSICTIGSGIFIFVVVPETKDRSWIDIRTDLRNFSRINDESSRREIDDLVRDPTHWWSVVAGYFVIPLGKK